MNKIKKQNYFKTSTEKLTSFLKYFYFLILKKEMTTSITSITYADLTDEQEEFILELIPERIEDEYELQIISNMFKDEYDLYISTDEIYDFIYDFIRANKDYDRKNPKDIIKQVKKRCELNLKKMF